MHFADWPVWAKPKDEQANKLTPLAEAAAMAEAGNAVAEQVNEEYEKNRPHQPVDTKARKKPGPKPKAKP